MEVNQQFRDIFATENTKDLVKNLIGAILVMVLSLLMIGLILAPEVGSLFRLAVMSGSILTWAVISASLLLLGFLLAFPIFLLARGLGYYREARTLDRIGTRIHGKIVEKWMGMSGGNHV